MAVVSLRSPLRDLADGSGKLEIDGSTVGEVIDRLERKYPRLKGWVMDERGKVRQHIAIFVNGERTEPEAPVTAADTVHVLPAISGGAIRTVTATQTRTEAQADVEEETELLAGTKKGLFVLRGPRIGP